MREMLLFLHRIPLKVPKAGRHNSHLHCRNTLALDALAEHLRQHVFWNKATATRINRGIGFVEHPRGPCCNVHASGRHAHAFLHDYAVNDCSRVGAISKMAFGRGLMGPSETMREKGTPVRWILVMVALVT